MNAATPSPGSSYIPVPPFAASSDCSLSRDLVATTSIVVDPPQSNLLNGSAIGPFTNPANKKLEALVLTTPSGDSASRLAHVRRAMHSETGWELSLLPSAIPANEVCSGLAANGSIYGFYEDGSAFWATQLASDGTTWNAPSQLDANVVSNLRVCYTPLRSLIVYGNDAKGNLVITSIDSNGNTVGPTSFTLQGLSLVAGDYALAMTSQTEFQLMANSNGTAYWVQGDTVNGVQPPVQMSGFNLTVSRVVMGFWSAPANAIMFLLIDSDHQLHYTQGTSADGTTVPIKHSRVTRAVGYEQTTNGTLHLYSVDEDNNLSVTHQKGWEGALPVWAPVIPLDTGITALAADTYPADSPSLFALDGQAFLRLHQQDALTHYWRSHYVHQTATEIFDTVRWRTQILLTDSNGAPLPDVPMTATLAKGASATEIVVAGKCYTIGHGDSATLKTDAAGRITFAMLVTNGLAASTLTFDTEGLPQPLSICPAQQLHTYLNGQGPLNTSNPGGGLQQLDCEGTTLATAQSVDPNTGQPTGSFAPGAAGSPALAAAAAIAIRNAAQISLSKMPNAPAPSTTCPALPSTGDAAMDDITHSIDSFFGDIWEGIQNGLIAISDFAVDVANDAVSLTMKVVHGIEGAARLILNDIESVGRFIAGVVQAIGADIKKLIDWLKALFDFAAIWRTKMAIQSMFASFGPWVQKMLTIERKGIDGWFSKQERTVSKYFNDWSSSNPSTFGAIGGWQDPSGGTNNTQPIAGSSVTVKSASNNVHHNWAQDKMSTYPSSNPIQGKKGGSWVGFTEKIHDKTGQDFVNALSAFGDAVKTLFDGVLSGGVDIAPFMSDIGDCVVYLLKFADDIVDDIFDLASDVVQLMCEAFGEVIELGFINTLWGWIAKAAGYPEDGELTYAALASLLVAFPTTVIYKIINNNAEPFPTQGYPQPWGCSQAAATALATSSSQNQEIAGLVQILSIFVVIPGIVAGSSRPWWFACIGIGISIGVWVAEHGLPDLTQAQWGEFDEVAEYLLVIVPVALIIMMGALSVEPAAAASTASTYATAIVSTLGGLVWVGAGIANVAKNGSSDDGWANILMPTQAATKFLQTPAFADLPWAQTISILFAVISCLVGGELEYLAG